MLFKVKIYSLNDPSVKETYTNFKFETFPFKLILKKKILKMRILIAA